MMPSSSVPRCMFCSNALAFRRLPNSDTWHCTCTYCRKRADRGEGETIAVSGYGSSLEAAETDWHSRVNTF